MQSLQTKLGSGLIISLIGVFTGLWFLISFSTQYLSEEYIASRLRHDAEMLLSIINFDKQGQINLDESRLNPVYSQPFSGHYYLIKNTKQSHHSRSLWDQSLQHFSVSSGQQQRSIQAGPNQQSLLVISNGFTKQGYELNISVAEDLNPVKKNIRQFQTRFTITAIALLLLLVILQSLILRHSLKSLTQLRAELRALQQGEIHQLNTDIPIELQPMVKEINHLLGVMVQRLSRSRHALSDLAHAIKKPLTVLQQLTDKNRQSLDADLYSALKQQATEINQLTDRILKRARLAGHVHSGTHFSFSQDLPDLLRTLDQMYQDKGIELQLNLTHGINCPIDREDMLELLGNILDNAYKWARHTIRLKIEANHTLRLCIEDDGPGAKQDQLSQLDKRGVRLDETVHGYGFGLAIASDMVQEYQGQISLGQSAELGGFRVDIHLPITNLHGVE